jgi:fibronectin-binding autotransporter adhesin
VIGGTLDLNNFTLTASSFNGTGGVVNLGSAALSVRNIGPDVYSGIIQGVGSVTKNGAGSLTLSGKNTYSGGTILNAGSHAPSRIVSQSRASLRTNVGLSAA